MNYNQAPHYNASAPQMYPPVPPVQQQQFANMPPPPNQQKIQVISQPKNSNFIGNLVKNAEKSVGSISRDISRTLDQHVVTSPLLDMFADGAVIQLISKLTNRALCCYPNTGIDANGDFNPSNLWTQYQVKTAGPNMVFLRNLGFPQENSYLVISNGYLFCTGAGDTGCTFLLHETQDHYITLESRQRKNNHIAVAPQGGILPAHLKPNKDCVKFSVKVLKAGSPAQP